LWLVYNNAGTTEANFVTGLSGNVRGIVFDTVGSFGNAMIVTTDSGNIYKISPSGSPTLLASVPGENVEGADIAPRNGTFGSFRGDLFVGSDNTGHVFAITPSGAVVGNAPVFTAAGGQAEELSFVPMNLGASGNHVEGFYASDYTPDVVKADPSQFAGLLGNLIITNESNHAVTSVAFSGGSFNQTGQGSLPNQPEDGLFVTPAVVNAATPEPSSMVLAALGGLAVLAYSRSRRGRGE
jgi:hypothetical protein